MMAAAAICAFLVGAIVGTGVGLCLAALVLMMDPPAE